MLLFLHIKGVLCMRVAIYIRVSTRLQEDKFSLSSQKLELEKYANEKCWKVIDIFKDVDSGGKFDKVGLNALMECIEDGLVDVVLCMDQDRLSRLDTIEWELLKQTLRENGVKIAEPGVLTDLTNENDEFISDIKNLIAKKEKRTVVRRMMRGLRQYVREGNFYGKLPFFYKFDKATKVVSIDEEYAWIVGFIDESYLDKRIGFKGIAAALNEITLSPNKKKWSAVTVYNILKNRAYHGDLIRNFKNYEPIIVEDFFPPLRTKETYLRIQNEMSKRHKKRETAHPHFLRDIQIKCAHCGYVLGIQTGSTKHRGKYNYYFQHSSFKQSTSDCYNHDYINTKRVYRPLLDKIKEILSSEETARKFLKFKGDDTDTSTLEKRIEATQKSYNKAQTKLDNLIDLYLDGEFNKQQLKKRKDKIEIDIQVLKDELEQLKRQFVAVTQNKITYDVILSYFSVVDDLDDLHESDLQSVLGDLFPQATYNFLSEEMTFHALVNDAQLDVTVKLEDSRQLLHDKVSVASAKRYKEYQQIIAANPNCTQKQLTRLSGYNALTVKRDLERYGRPGGLKNKKGDPLIREHRMNEIRDMLKVNVSYAEMARILEMDPATVRRYAMEIRNEP